MMTHAFMMPGTAIVAAAVRCHDNEDPTVVARQLGVDLSGLTRQGGVHLSDSPPSPQEQYWTAVSAAAREACAHLARPNEAWTASDHRWRDGEVRRLVAQATASVPLPTEPEPRWVWSAEIGYVHA